MRRALDLGRDGTIAFEGHLGKCGSKLKNPAQVIRASLALGFVLLVGVACSQPPAPVRMGSVIRSGSNDNSQATRPDPGAVVPLPAPPRPLAARSGSSAKAASASAVGTVTVVAGDTVYAIARRHRVGVRAIMSLNGLQPPYRLDVGQRLRLPASRGHVVVGGDTVYGLSQRYGVDMSALVRLNRLPAPYRLKVGQTLQIPSTVRTPEKVIATDESARTSNAAAGEPAPAVSIVGAGDGKFIWPANGRLLSVFGDKGGGKFNEGINIATAPGSRIKATAAGTVAYAGNELRGYGNLLLVRHADGWMSAYAHNEELLVKRGDAVNRGQVIATAGRTGNVSRPQSHFELRRRGKAVNPLRYLPKADATG